MTVIEMIYQLQDIAERLGYDAEVSVQSAINEQKSNNIHEYFCIAPNQIINVAK